MSTSSENSVSPDLSVNKWLMAFTVIFGAFMAVMDISIVNVAMPHMMGAFGEDMSTITWVATAYSIAEIIMVTMAGWFSTLIGRKRLYLWSFGLFTVGSVLCGTATTFHQMLFYRILQGIGGGALIPVSQAILRESFPQEEQGMAMAIFGMGVVLAPAAGPIFGGWLTDNFGWPWVFFVNVPVSIVGMLMVATFVHDPPYLRRGIHKIDWGGIILLTVTLTTMQVVLEKGQSENWFESRLILMGTIICGVALIGFIFWEMKTPEPVVNIRILRDIPLSLGSLISIVFGIAIYGSTFIIPQLTQNLLGYSAFDAGMVVGPRAFMLVLFMPIVGRLYNHVDARALVLVGIMIIIWSFYDLSRLSLTIGFWDLVPMMLIQGMGIPFMFVTLSTLSLSTVSRSDLTDAASMYTLSRRIGGNIGYAIAATIVARGQQVHRSYMVDHVTPSNHNYTEFSQIFAKVLNEIGLNAHALQQTVHALFDRFVNLQATMLAYNDVSAFFGFLFLFTIPMVFFLPPQPLLHKTHLISYKIKRYLGWKESG